MDRSNEGALPDPLAYFLTWPTYGTWLPGNDRGWVKYRHGFQLPDPQLKLEAAARMTEASCRLDARQRRLVESTIMRHCEIRNWTLHAVNCRSNHVHVVVTAPNLAPDQVREQFKAWCTRRLKAQDNTASESGLLQVRENWWAERGSDRYINDLDSLEKAIQYVKDSQDAPH